jgi:hypothetical protein
MSLANLIYLVRYKPFEDSRQLKLELFNEAIVLIAGYHMIMFTDLQPYIEEAILVNNTAKDAE